MPVTAPELQEDFVAAFDPAIFNPVRIGLAAVPNKNYSQTLNGTDDAEQIAVLREWRNTPTGESIKYVLRQNEASERVSLDLEVAAGSPERFHAVLQAASDGLAAALAAGVTAGWRDNAVPTLTSMADVVGTVADGVETELTLVEIKAQGNEADGDGTVDALIVTEVSTGTLKIGATAETATPWAAGSNDVIDATKNAYWTSAVSASGTINAFKVKAMDNDGWVQTTAAVQVTMTVT